jgi:hypothetical protein
MATIRYNLRPICKQEVTGSIPVGSTANSQLIGSSATVSAAHEPLHAAATDPPA